MASANTGAAPEHYDQSGKKVENKEPLINLIMGNGAFSGETLWGDDLMDVLVKEAANIVTIKMLQRKFGNGKDIFYCQGLVDAQCVSFTKYHSDIHFEAIKLVQPGQKDQYVFDATTNIKDVKEMIEAYKTQCGQY